MGTSARISRKVSLDFCKLCSKSVIVQVIRSTKSISHLGSELALLVGSHEDVGQSESSEGQVTLGALASIVDKRDGVLVVLLVVVLVLDEAEGDKVAHGRTGVPSNIVRIHVDLLEVSDHLVLVGDVGLLSGSRGGERRGIVLVAVGGRGVDGREGEGVGDLEDITTVHANDGSGGSRRESGRAVLSDLEDHLHIQMVNSRDSRGGGGASRLTRASTWTFWKGASLVASAILTEFREDVI